MVIFYQTLNKCAKLASEKYAKFDSLDAIFDEYTKKNFMDYRTSVDYIEGYFAMRDWLQTHPSEENIARFTELSNMYAKTYQYKGVTDMPIDDYYNLTHSNEYGKVMTKEIGDEDFEPVNSDMFFTQEERKNIQQQKDEYQKQLNLETETRLKAIGKTFEMGSIDKLTRDYNSITSQYDKAKLEYTEDKKAHPDFFKKVEERREEDIRKMENDESFDFSREEFYEGIREDSQKIFDDYNNLKDNEVNQLSDMYVKLREKCENRSIFQTIFHPFNSYNENKMFEKVESRLKAEHSMTDKDLDNKYTIFTSEKNKYLGNKEKWESKNNLTNDDKTIEKAANNFIKDAEIVDFSSNVEGYVGFRQKSDIFLNQDELNKKLHDDLTNDTGIYSQNRSKAVSENVKELNDDSLDRSDFL